MTKTQESKSLIKKEEYQGHEYKEGRLKEKTSSWYPIEISKEKEFISVIKLKIGNATLDVPKDFNDEHLLNVVRVLNLLC